MTKTPIPLTIPLSDETIRSLRAGDPVLLSGTLLTGRDRAHQWLVERFIRKSVAPSPEDVEVYQALKGILAGGLIYHCGPIVSKTGAGDYRFVSAGPTTSLREESCQAEVIRHFNLKGVIGKGGMGADTLAACRKQPAVYFHAVGGAAALIAQAVEEVLGVYKLEFGIPEAMWVIRVRDFPAVVTMDAHGASLHKEIRQLSKTKLETLAGL